MKKLTKIFILSITAFFTGLASASQTPSLEGLINWRYFTDDEKVKSAKLSSQLLTLSASPVERLNGLNYLNTLRNGAGLISYSTNSLLDTAAQNHTDYLILNNTLGHNEVENNPGFTGVSPGDRITAAGYIWTSYSENISAGDNDIYESIDGLISAIYHRFGFLGFNHNEIGIGSSYDEDYDYKSVYGFDMANAGDPSVTRQLNPQYVLWPHNNYSNAQTSFNNYESPDPTPECPPGGITGNPISIEFNPDKNSAITINSFKLFRNDGSELTNIKNLTANLNDDQFVIFPMTSLSLDSRYRAEFDYTESGVVKSISWNFNTRRYTDKRYEVTDSNTYDVISGQSYIIHLKPEDCTISLSSYGWDNSIGTVVERLSPDIFRISITRDTTFYSGSLTYTLQLAQSDNAIEPSSTSSFIVPIINYLLF